MARIRSRWVLPFLAVLTVIGGLLGSSSVGASAPQRALLGVSAAQRSSGRVQRAHVELVGTVNVRHLGAAAAAGRVGTGRGPGELGPWAGAAKKLTKKQVRISAGQAPSPPDTPVVVNENREGWEGLDHADQRLAGGGNQFSLEPPDQGLCVGGVSPLDPSYGPEVVESVNDALVFYDAKANQFTVPITLSSFYGLPPTIDRTKGKFGPFISDPKCYFDVDTQRWFHSVLVISQDKQTGAFKPPAFVYFAVSTSSEALGRYFIYRIDATDASHPNCPCFGDQPLIGADKYGFYISTAEYDLDPFGGNFNGPQIYAMSKLALESGKLPKVVHFSDIMHVSGGRTTGTVQPAMSPDATFETGNNGTEYFLSGFDCLPFDGCPIAPGQFDQITIWAVTNSQSLSGPTPNLHLSNQDITVGDYENPVPQVQKDGPRPLGELVGEPVPVINANDARMNQLAFAQGLLWGGINTTVLPGPRDGIEYFIVEPSVSNDQVGGTIHSEGYVAAAERFVSFPSVGVNPSGHGVIAMSLMGPNDFPSSAQIAIAESGVSGPIEIVRVGFRPEDGFTCYAAFGGGICRWGDYSASVGTPDGTIYSGTELIGDDSRTFFANWSTFVSPISP